MKNKSLSLSLTCYLSECYGEVVKQLITVELLLELLLSLESTMFFVYGHDLNVNYTDRANEFDICYNCDHENRPLVHVVTFDMFSNRQQRSEKCK